MSPIYSQASFILSAPELKHLPADEGYEVAFAGRSNAGKSSALNALVGSRQLARTSKTPGRTQAINLFELDAQRRLVDLPGYGYAKVSASIRQRWEATLSRYLARRHALRGLVMVMDIRHPLTALDRQMIDWLQPRALPLHLLLTKADKLSRGAQQKQLHGTLNTLNELGIEATLQSFSAPQREGVADLISVLDQWLEIDIIADGAADGPLA